MSFQNIDPNRANRKPVAPTAAAAAPTSYSNEQSYSNSDPASTQAQSSNNTTLTNLGDSINQLLRNIAMLGTLADTAITGTEEQKMQYEVQNEVTADLSSRIQKTLNNFNASVLSSQSSIPRSEVARLRSQYYKLEKDFNSVLNSKLLITEKVDRRKALIKARCEGNSSNCNKNKS